jgi:hypothetical protein
MVVPCRIVARVKVPPTLAFDIIQTLTGRVSGRQGCLKLMTTGDKDIGVLN